MAWVFARMAETVNGYGETVRNERGHEFYEEIGHKGGQKVKELIEAGKRRQAQQQTDADRLLRQLPVRRELN